MVVNNTASAPHAVVVAPISTGSNAHQTVHSRPKTHLVTWLALTALAAGVAYLFAIGIAGENHRSAQQQAQKKIALQRQQKIQSDPKLRAEEKQRQVRERLAQLRSIQERNRKNSAPQQIGAQSDAKQEKAVRAFADLLNNEGNGQLFSNFGRQGNKLTVVATDAWNAQPYRYRLQRAQAFDLIWMKACGTSEPTQAPFEITDSMGNKIGGWNTMSGIWVAEN